MSGKLPKIIDAVYFLVKSSLKGNPFDKNHVL